MFDSWRASGREVAVIGLGRSGGAVAELLRRELLPVYATDRGTTPLLEATAARLRSLGACVDLGRHDLDRIRRAVGVVVSPGVPPDSPALMAAREAGVDVRAEVDLGLEALEGVPYVAITGTNGKTTTTALVAHLFVALGRRGVAVGNIGTALSQVALENFRPEWMAVELSSFQLHDARHVRPVVGILTNLAPDHLDRYASTEEYFADKRRLFQHDALEGIWVLNADDPASRSMAMGLVGRRLWTSVTRPADAWFDRAAGALCLGERSFLARSELGLLGDHNVMNALMAALAVHATGGQLEALAGGLRTFRALPHRMEPVGESDGVLWINDSKATNIASTVVALAAIDRPYVLLLGGRHKGEPYDRLLPLLQKRCRAVIAYGEAKPIVVADLGGKFRVVEAGSFDEVMAEARSLARPGEAILLSPACSSYDMFNNYEERGDAFRRAAAGI